ncbi:MAG: hypothetical protein R3F60_03070 [bacterium]
MSRGSFKRINFFKGFLTTEQDWNDAERYHVEKRKLHNRMFHAPGVVNGHGDDLKVQSRGRGDLSLEVGAGYAIDGQGSDIFLLEKQIKTLNPADFKLPQTIYLVLRYVEEFDDFIAYKENLDYQGHRRVREDSKIEFSIVEPNIDLEVELARIYLEKGARRITDARDPLAPGPNEIDLRFVPKAGRSGGRIDPMLRWRLDEMVRAMKMIFSYLARVKKILAAQDAFHAVISFEMLLRTNQVDGTNVWDLLAIIADLSWDVVDEVESRVPDLSARKEFTGYKKNVDIMRGLVYERRRTAEGLDNMVTYNLKACESLKGMLDKIRPDVIEVKAMDGAIQTAAVGTVPAAPLEGGITFEELKTYSGEFTASLIVDGKEWRLVDMIDVLNAESEKAHDFQIKEAEDTYRTRQKLRYPDGTVVEDTGIAHEGGFTEFKVKGLTAHQDVVMIRRMDFVRGDYQAEIHVNGQRLDRVLDCRGEDRKFRWRNWPYVIPAQHISTAQISVKQVMLTADRDINMFRFWFYQPI